MTKKALYTGLDPTHYKTNKQLFHLPLIQTIPFPSSHTSIEKALESFSSFTHIIFTSKTTISLLFKHLSYHGYSESDWKRKKYVVVGQVTQKHLQDYEITPEIIAIEETAEGIIQELKKINLEDTYFFWPHSSESRTILPNFFSENQLNFKECVFYETKPLIPKTSIDWEEFDEIIFTIPSTIKAFLEIFGKIPSNKRLTSIGPITQNYLNSVLIN